MVGHGSPSSAGGIAPPKKRVSTQVGRCALRGCWRLILIFLATVLVGPAAVVAVDPTMHLRVAWGGGDKLTRQWQGGIRISSGTLAIDRPLGVEADEPGSMW